MLFLADENPAAMQKSGAISNNNKRQENMMPLLCATLLLTIASTMVSLLNNASGNRRILPLPAIRNDDNEQWLSVAIIKALLAKTIPIMRFPIKTTTITIIKSYLTAMLSIHPHSDVIATSSTRIDLIPRQQQQQQQQIITIIIMMTQSRQHEFWWHYYGNRPCYRIHNNIPRNSYNNISNNNNNNCEKYFMQNCGGGCLYVSVVIRIHLSAHPPPACNVISNTITVTDTDIDSDTASDVATDDTTCASIIMLYMREPLSH